MKHEGHQAIDLCELVLAVCDERTRNKGVVIVALCEALVIKATRFTHATNADPDVVRFIGGAALDSALAQLTSKVDVNVYFTTTASEDQVLALQRELQPLPEFGAARVPRGCFRAGDEGWPH